MKVLFDTLPIILFYIGFRIWDVFVATAIAMGTSFLQIGWVLVRRQKVSKIMWVSLAIITVLGGATLLFHNETFVKWKPTVSYGLFALTLAVSAFVYKKNLLKSLLDEQITLPDDAWRLMNNLWIVFFVVMAVTNVYVAYTFSTRAWADFKLASLGLIFIFSIIQALLLYKHLDPESDTASASANPSPAQPPLEQPAMQKADES